MQLECGILQTLKKKMIVSGHLLTMVFSYGLKMGRFLEFFKFMLMISCGQVVDAVCRIFSIGKHESNVFRYVGLKITPGKDSIYLDQIEYNNSIEPLILSRIVNLQKKDFCDETELLNIISWLES